MNALLRKQQCGTHTSGKSGRSCKRRICNLYNLIYYWVNRLKTMTFNIFKYSSPPHTPSPRQTEKKAETFHRASGTMNGLESVETHNSFDHIWRPARPGKQLRGRHTRQTPLICVSQLKENVQASMNTADTIWHCLPLKHNMKHVAEPATRRNVPPRPTELPKLNLLLPGPQMSFPVSATPSFTATHRGTLPAITSKKCQPRLAEVNARVLHRHCGLFIRLNHSVTEESLSQNTADIILLHLNVFFLSVLSRGTTHTAPLSSPSTYHLWTGNVEATENQKHFQYIIKHDLLNWIEPYCWKQIVERTLFGCWNLWSDTNVMRNAANDRHAYRVTTAHIKLYKACTIQCKGQYVGWRVSS